jgi:hypothetical protein
VREKKDTKQTKKLGPRIIYFFSVTLIVVLWVYAFRSYFEQYDSVHPEITLAMPWVQVDTIRAAGVYLWDETRLESPVAGAVRFPNGTGPVRIPKGAVVARVGAGGSFRDVKAPQEGYFVAGLDGLEGEWRYSSIWPGYDELPKAPPVKMFEDGQSVKKGSPVGKLVSQPQDLRFVGYADISGNLERDLASNAVMVKMDLLDTPSHADIRVYEKIGHRVKIHLSAPWFPPSVLLSRNCEMIIEAGSVTGVTVPESSIAIRDGSRGVFILNGSDAVFTKVEGRFIGGSRFLVTKGMKLGDAVIVNGSSAREGRVKLW